MIINVPLDTATAVIVASLSDMNKHSPTINEELMITAVAFAIEAFHTVNGYRTISAQPATDTAASVNFISPPRTA
ncbi:MAG: hypothetical protein L6R38_004412 [Xanthoria sp. 2 TBL-2021]|nr:MAG: hypothetical protein L6R38_004412 [Xanthoria sp. 2 TBL-2021]